LAAAPKRESDRVMVPLRSGNADGGRTQCSFELGGSSRGVYAEGCTG
jgi:hypothetical protein